MITLKCLECGKSFKAQRTSAKFCSANCRVKYNIKSDGKKTTVKKLKSIDKSIKVASEIPPVEKPKTFAEKSDAVYEEIAENKEIADRFRALCKSKKVSVEDMFIWIDNNYGKKLVSNTELLRGRSGNEKSGGELTGISKAELMKRNNEEHYKRTRAIKD